MPVPAPDFLSALPDRHRRPISASGIAVVVAHPDDETIGCGALLGRLRGVTVVMVTDGVPRNLADARALGFETGAEYAAARFAELEAALTLAGVAGDQIAALAIPDQHAAYRMSDLAGSLADIFQERGTGVVLTHAYEGGHPDHDATALAVSIAAGLGGTAVVEMPFYRLGPQGMLTQSFAEPARHDVAVPLTAAERTRKQQMIAAYVTQQQTLAPFAAEIERFRPAPDHDFAALPNGGRLLYECHDWGMTGERWLDLAQAALAEFGLLRVPKWV